MARADWAEQTPILHPQTYLPINSYGVIGDCHSAVLISPEGSVDWGSLPDFDSPAIFCRLLDAERGGYFQIAPTDSSLHGSQSYLDRSNVLQTRFTSSVGAVELTDFMPLETLSAWPLKEMDASWMNSYGDHHCLVRVVECKQGQMSVTMKLKVSPGYASVPSEVSLSSDNLSALIAGGQQYIALSIIGADLLSSFALNVVQKPEAWHPIIQAQFLLHEGDRLLFVLGVESTSQAALQLIEHELPRRDFDAELTHTVRCWREWIAGCANCAYQGPYAQWVERSALALKLMTYVPTGAIVAAPTTSLPEDLGGERNWDYRFTWLRDATFTLYAFNILGFTEEAHAFMHWLCHLSYADGEDLQIMYGIRGERELTEQELPHLSGYGGSRPVRIGNGAAKQKQLDVFGEILDCIHLYHRQGNMDCSNETLKGPLWEMMRSLVDYVCIHWQQPDNGIWEVRDGPRHFVYSKVMCWVALDRGIRAAEQLCLEADLVTWVAVRDQIRADILAHGYNTRIGAFTQSYGDSMLDAANLLLPLVGFLSPDDPRMLSTVRRTMEMLTNEHGFVYRYRSTDGLPGDEGTFSICTFWLVDNLAMQGRIEAACSLFERLLTYASPLGLFSEEIASQSGMALGNYPQAFTHIALINSANNLRKAKMRRLERCAEALVANYSGPGVKV
jgi:GH15 family glucan-1,4-alpha-glucosidase